jgi:hypothetical protein
VPGKSLGLLYKRVAYAMTFAKWHNIEDPYRNIRPTPPQRAGVQFTTAQAELRISLVHIGKCEVQLRANRSRNMHTYTHTQLRCLLICVFIVIPTAMSEIHNTVCAHVCFELR